MDARRLSKNVIVEAIERKSYELTGVTENGEVVLAILGDTERDILNRIFKEKETDEEKLTWIKKAMDLIGGNAQEYVQVHLQNIAKRNEVCKANGLRLK
ncbi:hypothetical protein [Clostridium paraputrificum]|uniref:hypothetical protein n=1 Tax=Clostridium paraputrificum TaxID=29363 RepID=UPI000C0785C0|nr:hypothetical protein [Clostridium paraputrificum]